MFGARIHAASWTARAPWGPDGPVRTHCQSKGRRRFSEKPHIWDETGPEGRLAEFKPKQSRLSVKQRPRWISALLFLRFLCQFRGTERLLYLLPASSVPLTCALLVK